MEALVTIIGLFQVLFLVGLWNQARLLRKVAERVLGCENTIQDLANENFNRLRQINDVEKRTESIRDVNSELIEIVKVLDQRTRKTIVFTPNRKKP